MSLRSKTSITYLWKKNLIESFSNIIINFHLMRENYFTEDFLFLVGIQELTQIIQERYVKKLVNQKYFNEYKVHKISSFFFIGIFLFKWVYDFFGSTESIKLI